jgi:DHA3 family macrolide efflux protein-like MFS transporter
MQLLKYRNFTLLWISYFVSLMGDWVLDIALPILVYQLTGSGTALGAMVAVEAIPGIILAPIAGVFVDRWNRQRVLIWTNILLGLSVLLLFLVQTAAQLWIIFLVGFLNACLGTFLYPARTALVPDLVPESELTRANSIMTLTVQGSRLIGPALGGAAISLAGPQLSFALDAASFFFAALCIAAIQLTTLTLSSEEPTSEKGVYGVYRDLIAGLQVIFSTPVLWATLMVWSVLILAAGAVTAVMVVFVREALGGAEANLGYLLSAQGLGTLMGGAAMMIFAARIKPVTAIIGGIFLAGVLFLIVANTSSLMVAAIALWGMGIMMAVSGIGIHTTFQTTPPEQFRGRVLATNNAVASLMLFLGAALAGFLTDTIGIRAVLNSAALLTIGAALLALTLLRPNNETSTEAPRRATEAIENP